MGFVLVAHERGDLLGGEMPPGSGGQSGKPDFSYADACQLADRMANRGQHPAHLSIAAFENCQLDLRLALPVSAVAFVASA